MPNMDNLFRSNRLVYRAVEDTEDDHKLFNAIQSDPDAFANSDIRLLRPETMKSSKDHAAYVADKTLLGVIICLAPDTSEADISPKNDISAPGDKPQSATKLTPIGSLHLRGGKPDTAHHRQTDISIDIMRPYQRKGYGGEAINWVLDWAFKQAGLHRVGIEAFSYNKGAMQLYERLGFVLEGRKREMFWFNGGWHDLVSYSMLEEEWKELRRQGKGLNAFAV